MKILFYFISAYKYARSYSLDYEFLWSFKQGLKDGLNIKDSINYALCEWDM